MERQAVRDEGDRARSVRSTGKARENEAIHSMKHRAVEIGSP